MDSSRHRRKEKCEGVEIFAEQQKGKENECKDENDILEVSNHKKRNYRNQLIIA